MSLGRLSRRAIFSELIKTSIQTRTSIQIRPLNYSHTLSRLFSQTSLYNRAKKRSCDFMRCREREKTRLNGLSFHDIPVRVSTSTIHTREYRTVFQGSWLQRRERARGKIKVRGAKHLRCKNRDFCRRPHCHFRAEVRCEVRG